MDDKARLQEDGGWTELKAKIQMDLEQYRREQKEIALMLEQSQVDVQKLAQRNASITTHLQPMQAQFDSLPRKISAWPMI